MDRRTFIKGSIAGAVTLTPWRGAAQQVASPSTTASLGQPIGRMPTRSSVDIASSTLSAGFEVLDRRGFEPEKTYPYLAELGVKWARCQTGWGRCETQRGRYDFVWLDEVVDNLLAIGIQPWFNVGYGNRLYTMGAPDEAAVGFTPVYDEASMRGWLAYVAALTKHFSDRVLHYEIWNEPNHAGFWRLRDPSPVDYANLVARTAPVIRENAPKAIIIGGAYAGLPFEFILACLRAGIAEHINVLSFHPYRERPEAGYTQEIERLRRILDTREAACLLWQGENGCPSVGGPQSAGALADLDWNETSQAKWLLRRILADLQNELALTSYFHTVDLVGYRGKTNYKGLLRGEDYTPKPAYFAYQRLCALFDAETSSLPSVEPSECAPAYPAAADAETLSKENVHHAVFVRSGKFLYAWWYPANLQEPWTDGTVTTRMTIPEEAALDEPVLLDPLSGDAYALSDMKRSGQEITLNNLPLRDYPLLLTDRALIED